MSEIDIIGPETKFTSGKAAEALRKIGCYTSGSALRGLAAGKCAISGPRFERQANGKVYYFWKDLVEWKRHRNGEDLTSTRTDLTSLDLENHSTIVISIKIYGDMIVPFTKAQEQSGLSKNEFVRQCIKRALAAGQLHKEE